MAAGSEGARPDVVAPQSERRSVEIKPGLLSVWILPVVLQMPCVALAAAVLLGVIWAAWHIVAMVQTGQSATWIAWHALA